MKWRILLVLVALTTTACGRASGTGGPADADGGRASTAGSGAATEPPVTAAASPSVEGDMLTALDGFVASTIHVNDPPNVNHPDLARFRTGAVLANAMASVRLNALVAIGYRLPDGSLYSHTPAVMMLSDQSAVVRDCVVDDAQQVNVANGQVLNNSVATKLFDTTLVLIDGGWKVSENSLVERWDGVTACDA